VGTGAPWVFLKNTLKGALVAKVASEARKPKNQAKAKSLLGSLRSRVSGKGAAAPTGRGRTVKASRGTVTRGTVTKGTARKAAARPR
jgi:hypothetical protein